MFNSIKKSLLVLISILLMGFLSCENQLTSGSNETGESNEELLEVSYDMVSADFSCGPFTLESVTPTYQRGYHSRLSLTKKPGTMVFADFQTMNGSDPVIPKVYYSYQYAPKLTMMEETSNDNEFVHTGETIGGLQVERGYNPFIEDWKGEIIGEMIQVDNYTQSSEGKSRHVSFYRKYENPVILGTITTDNFSDFDNPARFQSAFLKIDSVNENGFTFKVEEWGYRNGIHEAVDINFLIIEKGAHVIELKNNIYYVLEAGTKVIVPNAINIRQETSFIDLLTDFDRTPFVFGTLEGPLNGQNPPAYVRIHDIDHRESNDHFMAALQYDEKDMIDNPRNYDNPTFHYMAFGRVGPRRVTHRTDVVDKHGWLHVNDSGQLVSESGAPVQLKGMSAFWTNWDEGRDFANEETIEWLVRDWEIDVYRIAVGVNPYDGAQWILTTNNNGTVSTSENDNCGNPCKNQGLYYVGNQTEVKSMIDDLVNACVERGIYVIIDWHVHDAYGPKVKGSLTLKNYIEAGRFFGAAARRYGNTPNVIFEIWNEPSGINNDTATMQKDWEAYRYLWVNSASKVESTTPPYDIKLYCNRIIQAIRSNGGKNLIICPTPNYDQELLPVAYDQLEDQGGLDRIMYACHFYAGTTSEWSQFITDDVTTFNRHNPVDDSNIPNPSSLFGRMKKYRSGPFYLPIFVTEWGTSQFDGGQDPGRYFGESESEQYLQFMEDEMISWCNWAVTDKDEGAAALEPGALKIGFWSDHGMTESGRFVRKWIRGEN